MDEYNVGDIIYIVDESVVEFEILDIFVDQNGIKKVRLNNDSVMSFVIDYELSHTFVKNKDLAHAKFTRTILDKVNEYIFTISNDAFSDYQELHESVVKYSSIRPDVFI